MIQVECVGQRFANIIRRERVLAGVEHRGTSGRRK